LKGNDDTLKGLVRVELKGKDDSVKGLGFRASLKGNDEGLGFRFWV
jgi:hypothetical protein